MKKESMFESNLKQLAPMFDCYYSKIPDPIVKTGQKVLAHRRDFDAVLVTKGKTYCVECKIDYNSLSDHQKASQKIVNGLNGSFIVLRKIFLKNGIKYRIETKTETLETKVISDIFEYLNGNGVVR